MQRWDKMLNTEEKIIQEKLENLYQDMLQDIITFMDQKKLTINDISEHLSIKVEELKEYFSLEKKNFSIYYEILKFVKEW